MVFTFKRFRFVCPYLSSTPGLEVSLERVSSDLFSFDLHRVSHRSSTSGLSPDCTRGVRRLTMLVHRFNAQPTTIQKYHCPCSDHRLTMNASWFPRLWPHHQMKQFHVWLLATGMFEKICYLVVNLRVVRVEFVPLLNGVEKNTAIRRNLIFTSIVLIPHFLTQDVLKLLTPIDQCVVGYTKCSFHLSENTSLSAIKL